MSIQTTKAEDLTTNHTKNTKRRPYALTLSRNLAVLMGVLAPALETWRRWSTWQNDPSSFFDDYILGGLMLLGAWQVTKNAKAGQKYLAAGWGFALGMVYASFLSASDGENRRARSICLFQHDRSSSKRAWVFIGHYRFYDEFGKSAGR